MDWQCTKCKDKKAKDLWTFGVGVFSEHVKSGEWFCEKCLEKLQKKIERKLKKNESK